MPNLIQFNTEIDSPMNQSINIQALNLALFKGSNCAYFSLTGIFQFAETNKLKQDPFATVIAQSSFINPDFWRLTNPQLLSGITADVFYGLKKEQFYIAGIKNLRKKINFLKLNHEYLNGTITEEEYETEVESNPGKYIVDVHLINGLFEVLAMHDVISQIGDDMTFDEVEEIFSIDSGSLKEGLDKILNNNNE